MTTPRLPDSPGSLSALIPAQRTAPPAVHVPAQRASTVTAPPAVPAQRLPVAPETIVGTPPEQQVLSPAPVVVGRDTRLAVLWTLLGATMGVLILVAAALVLPLL
ncbi:hypothetical protein EV383_3572 [Pseudonocardia sediminis]|uniref:Uncharacterized protein n=1 Tax=Pseudonocardia sediminis TaxID=1397368 RepID=A0A4Q7UY10_PSEST|nr:hypothetical protein [Pseudonocardia sediminis]RZT86675.1 hypothetical protein EV383_3572 [Pseudonocardia sediminis]